MVRQIEIKTISTAMYFNGFFYRIARICSRGKQDGDILKRQIFGYYETLLIRQLHILGNMSI